MVDTLWSTKTLTNQARIPEQVPRSVVVVGVPERGKPAVAESSESSEKLVCLEGVRRQDPCAQAPTAM